MGQAGASVGLPDEAVTSAAVLKSMGYATGQFGKNHLGDLNRYLPTLHGLDEFHGYLYHLDALSDPYWFSYPKDPAFRAKYGPRNVLHTWATDTDDPTEMPRWGKVGKQKIQDDGPLPPHPRKASSSTWRRSMTSSSSPPRFHVQGEEGRQAVLRLAQSDAHACLYVPLAEVQGADERRKQLRPRRGRDDPARRHRRQHHEASGRHRRGQQHHRCVHHRQRHRDVHLARRGQHAVQGTKRTVYEGGFRAPAIIRWPGNIQPGSVENGIFSGLDWFPTFVAAAGDPDITTKLLKGVKIGDRTYKNHLDGYNQLDLLLGKGPSARHEILLLRRAQLGAIRIDDMKFRFYEQPEGWTGPKLYADMPAIVNLRQDPFERFTAINGETLLTGAPGYMMDFFAREFWRFVLVQDRGGTGQDRHRLPADAGSGLLQP